MSSFLRYYSAHEKRIFPDCVVLRIASNTSAVLKSEATQIQLYTTPIKMM